MHGFQTTYPSEGQSGRADNGDLECPSIHCLEDREIADDAYHDD